MLRIPETKELLFCAPRGSPAFSPRRIMDDCRFCAHNKESLERCERTCEGDFKQSVSRRLWKEELYRGMLNGLKLKWQPFSQWSGAGSKAWTWFLEQHPPGSGFVCGSGGENKELDCLRPKRRRRWGGRESVSCGLKEDAVWFHPLLSNCCSQKTFHPLSWPEAAFPLRPEQLCDLLQVLECLKLISRTQWEIPAAKTECSPLSFVCKCCLVLHLSHADSCQGCFVLFCLFFLSSPTEWWMIYCCCRLALFSSGSMTLKSSHWSHIIIFAI